jgi:hypothetical protein
MEESHRVFQETTLMPSMKKPQQRIPTDSLRWRLAAGRTRHLSQVLVFAYFGIGELQLFLEKIPNEQADFAGYQESASCVLL